MFNKKYRENPKHRKSGGGIKLPDGDERLAAIWLYRLFSQQYGWTPTEIDGVDIDVLFDYLAIESYIDRNNRTAYIDEIF